ncbi:MAG: hypothetical protein ACI4PF_01080 [Christensenellales bacterium]
MPTIIENGKAIRLSVFEYNLRLQALRRKLNLNEDGTLKHYTVKDLDKIWVSGQEFSGISYQGLLTVNTKTYVEEPERSNDGSMPNINDYVTFVVPRCKVNFKYFNIEDYQRLCEAVTSNEFTVKYWDKQFNEFVIHKMYCEPEEMAKLYNLEFDVFGVLDYEVSFIGTLNDLQEFKVVYDANGGSIAGSPTLYNPEQSYTKGAKVYLDDSRYFEAIWYENTFIPQKTGQDTILLTNTTYWKPRNLYEYSNTIQFSKGNIAYENIYDNSTTPPKLKGRNYYIALKDNFSGRPLSDTTYWQKIAVSKYVPTKKYTSNKTYNGDETYGNFVIESDTSNVVYEAIYYFDTFQGKDPTNTTYWRQLALGTGIEIKWGNSIVVADPETLFDAPVGYSSDSWNTKADGTGYTYYLGQSLNVFKNLTLYAQWVGKEGN